jgi:hypothetical protein
LDYSAEVPRVYEGWAVGLADLKPQLLRDAAAISDAAGHFRGKVSALSCPSCGAAVQCVPGFTIHIVCPNCQSAVDTSGSVATVLAAGQSVDSVRFSLELGSEATISGARYTVLGAMRRSDGESTWSEYLLYSPGKTFIWLIETRDGWQRAEVLDRWPVLDNAGHATLNQSRFDKDSEYSAHVVFAAGSFNWRVKVGDAVRVTEFSSGPLRLAAELSSEELTWSRSSAMPSDQVSAALGRRVSSESQAQPDYKTMARRVLIPMFIVNIIPFTLAPGSVLAYTLLAAAAIYVPAYFLDASNTNRK